MLYRWSTSFPNNQTAAVRVATSLGAGDKAKLGEYLESVREIERRIQHVESQPVDLELPERPTDVPDSFDAHTKLMFDLQALAWQADITRVFSMVMSRELSSRTFATLGVPEQHHAVSHHRNDPELITKKAKISTKPIMSNVVGCVKVHSFASRPLIGKVGSAASR